jgi:hypothetical protein
VLVPQSEIGQNTAHLALDHGELFDKCASAIFRNRPRFSIFGVGDCSFSPWKVAISGFYKQLEFRVVAPQGGKAVMLDDTSYSPPLGSSFSSLVFWDAKRPITVVNRTPFL